MMHRLEIIFIYILRFACFLNACNGYSSTLEFMHSLSDETQVKSDNFDIEYVKKKYESSLFNHEFIFYPAQHAKKLIIVFSYHSPNLYALWSWFWRKDEDWQDTAYLFIKDKESAWYVGFHGKSTIQDFSNIINHIIEKTGVSKNHVFTVGTSMGGYGAILYATILELKGAIADVPQIDFETWKKYFIGFTLGVNFIDLISLLNKSTYVPAICLHYGNYVADYTSAHQLIELLKYKGSLFLIDRRIIDKHQVFITKAIIDAEINFMDNF